MFDQYLRPNTNRLQDDLRYAMKAYNSDKQRLLSELSTLRGSERSSSPMSLDSSSIWSTSTDVMSRRSTYFRAPNIAATNSAKREPSLSSTDKKWKDKRDNDRIKKEKDMFKLPVIHSANSMRSDWESGRNLSRRDSLTSGLVEPLPGIAAARALLKDTMKIPSIYDPQRSDKTYETPRATNSSRKKVTFADEKREPLMSVSEIEPNDLNSQETKNSERDKSLVPTINFSKNHFQPMLRPRRPRKTSLPPLNLSLTAIRKDPQRVTEGVNEWKSLYGNMVDPEKRTKALADILYAVRVKKYENEQAMKYGNSPRTTRSDSNASEHYLQSSTDRIQYRDENGQKSKGVIPKHLTPRGSQRNSSLQLQNYLRHMSRQRRFMEQIAAEEYRRLTQIAHNKAVQEMAPSETSVQA